MNNSNFANLDFSVRYKECNSGISLLAVNSNNTISRLAFRELLFDIQPRGRFQQNCSSNTMRLLHIKKVAYNVTAILVISYRRSGMFSSNEGMSISRSPSFFHRQFEKERKWSKCSCFIFYSEQTLKQKLAFNQSIAVICALVVDILFLP